jgi:phospholipid transport system substrate-binding protein
MRKVDMAGFFRRGLFVLLASLPLLANAAPTAQQVVQQTVDQLLGDLKANKAAYQADPATFYAALERTLGPVVDADGISRSIMTVKYSRRATPAQMQRFQDNFKLSLMQFYGNALLEYDNQEIRVLPAKVEDAERTSVGMEFKDSKGTVYPVSYTMTKVDGQWKLRNLIINGINIGKLFRDQFADTMQKNGNNLDKAIDGWADIVAKAKTSATNQQANGI